MGPSARPPGGRTRCVCVAAAGRRVGGPPRVVSMPGRGALSRRGAAPNGRRYAMAADSFPGPSHVGGGEACSGSSPLRLRFICVPSLSSSRFSSRLSLIFPFVSSPSSPRRRPDAALTPHLTCPSSDVNFPDQHFFPTKTQPARPATAVLPCLVLFCSLPFRSGPILGRSSATSGDQRLPGVVCRTSNPRP